MSHSQSLYCHVTGTHIYLPNFITSMYVWYKFITRLMSCFITIYSVHISVCIVLCFTSMSCIMFKFKFYFLLRPHSHLIPTHILTTLGLVTWASHSPKCFVSLLWFSVFVIVLVLLKAQSYMYPTSLFSLSSSNLIDN